MLLKSFLEEGTASLEPLYPREEARGMVMMLCEHILGVKSYTHIIEPDYTIGGDALDELNSSMDRLRSGEPVQYVLGECEFCSRRFRLTPQVLIPRPETELLCREALKYVSASSRILDLCTGSGCIAWTLALSVPGARVTGVDISEGALEVARGQVFPLGGAIAPGFIKADILDEGHLPLRGPFDLIVSNPPYIMEKEKSSMRPNVLDHEPHLALFVPDDEPLLFYRAIARWATVLLAPGGTAIVEINETLGEETAELFRSFGFGKVSILKDFFEKNRYILFSK